MQHRVIPTVVEMGSQFIEEAKPVIRQSAKTWRHTVDHKIAPSVRAGLVSVGKHTVQGIKSGVELLAETVMGAEAKEETEGALSVLADAVMGTNFTQQPQQHFQANNNNADYDDYSYYSGVYPTTAEEETSYQAQPVFHYEDPPQFQYQQLNPSEYKEQISYPPHLNPQSLENPPMDYPDLDPRQYHTNANDIYSASATAYATSGSERNPRYHQISPQHSPPYSSSSSSTQPDNYNTIYGNNQRDGSEDYYYYPARPQTVEEALYVLGKNLLGRNVTDRIFPVAKQVAEGFGQVGAGIETIGDAFPPLPTVEFDSSGVRVKTIEDLETAPSSSQSHQFRDERNSGSSQFSTQGQGLDQQRITSSAPRCTTPQGGSGRCMDIQNCPLLLADLDKLRKSICFKSLFVPGVCCPDAGYVEEAFSFV